MFQLIDKSTWKRTPYFNHFFNQIRCTYSITTNIEITKLMQLKEQNAINLYPLLIYIVTKAVNNHEEFRTSINNKGELGIWDVLHPCYTVFHQESETFSNIWTDWNENINIFIGNYNRDKDKYGNIEGISAKQDVPDNTFPISSLPWTTFTGFNLNIFADGSFLLPIFTYGKYIKKEGKFFIPLSIQAHHAVCDGFHTSRLINEIQELANNIRI